MTTWRKELTAALEEQREQFSDIVAITLSEIELDTEFDDGYGWAEGASFTAWTANRVYFPACDDDGVEWAASVPRNTCEEATRHIGR